MTLKQDLAQLYPQVFAFRADLERGGGRDDTMLYTMLAKIIQLLEEIKNK